MPDPWEQIGQKPGPISDKLNRSLMMQATQGKISPISKLQYFWDTVVAPQMQKGETNLSRVFNWMDLPLTGINAALMKKPVIPALQQSATNPITLQDVVSHYAGKPKYDPTHNVISQRPGTQTTMQKLSHMGSLMGVAGAAEELLNPSTYMGPPLGKIAERLKAPLGKLAERSGVAAMFDPLIGTTEAERSAGRTLAQEFKHADRQAQDTALRMFQNVKPEDREMVSHLVEAMKSKPNPEDELRLANAKIERPDLVEKAEELHALSMRTGVVKGVGAPKPVFGKNPVLGPYRPPLGHVPHVPKRGPGPEMTYVQTEHGPMEIPKRVGGGGGGRTFSQDPGSFKHQKVRSLTDIAKDPLKTPEMDAAVLAERLQRSAGRHSAMQSFAKELQDIGALSNTEYLDPATGKVFPSRDYFEQYARQSGANAAGLREFKGKYTPQQQMQISKIQPKSNIAKYIEQEKKLTGFTPTPEDIAKKFKLTPAQARRSLDKLTLSGKLPISGTAENAQKELQAGLRAKAAARQQAEDMYHSIKKRGVPIVQPGKQVFSESEHLPEALRGKQATESLVRLVDQVGSGGAKETAGPAVQKTLDALDTLNSGVRAGIIANVAYHPIFNIMPQFESLVGGFGASAPAFMVRQMPTILRFGRAAAKHTAASIYDAADAAMKLKLDNARKYGALSAIGTTNKTETLLDPGVRGKIARAWDWNGRTVFAIDDLYSAEAFDVLTKHGMSPELAARRVRDALGRYGAAHNTPLEREAMNRITFFWPWMKTVMPYWLGGPGLKNLKPIMTFHGYQSNYNKATDTQTSNPIQIGHTTLPFAPKLLGETINNPMYPLGWALGHTTPPISLPLSLLTNNAAPFSTKSQYPSGEIKPWARIRTQGAPAWYQGLESARYAGQTAIPGGMLMERAVQGYQAQGPIGAVEALFGPTLQSDDPTAYKMTIAAQKELAKGDIDFDTYLMRLQMIKELMQPAPARKPGNKPSGAPAW